MMHRLVGQVSFYVLLLQIDQDLAEEARKAKCPLCQRSCRPGVGSRGAPAKAQPW